MASILTRCNHPLWSDLALYLDIKNKPFNYEWRNSFDKKVNESYQQYGTAQEFYARTDVYLYQNLAYFLEGYKRPYYGILFQMIGSEHVTILDYGCGSGYDGMLFHECGMSVSFADVSCQALDYLQWRMVNRTAPLPIYSLSETRAIPQHDVVWCMDVLEHLPPSMHKHLIYELEHLGRTVVMNFVDDKMADGSVHYQVDVETLTEWIQGRRHTWWHDYHIQADGNRVRLVVIGEMAQRLFANGKA